MAKNRRQIHKQRSVFRCCRRSWRYHWQIWCYSFCRNTRICKYTFFLAVEQTTSLFFIFKIDCCIKLSGMPDLTLSFMNPRLFDDVSFHPCVRYKRWEVREFCWQLYSWNNVFHCSRKGFYRLYHPTEISALFPIISAVKALWPSRFMSDIICR